MAKSRSTRESALVKTNTFKKQGKDVEVNKGEWTGKAEIKTWTKFLAVGEENFVLSFILTYSRTWKKFLLVGEQTFRA